MIMRVLSYETADNIAQNQNRLRAKIPVFGCQSGKLFSGGAHAVPNGTYGELTLR